MAARHAILIGNGRYPEESQLSPLSGPPNDVRYLAEVLANPEMGAFEVEQYVDVEHYRLLPNLEHRLATARHDDTLLVYYSGHGKVDFRGQLCLTTLNTRLSALQTTSVPLPVLKSLIDSSPCRSILLILDCCFSGAAAKAFVRSTVEDQLTLAQGAGLHILTSATSIETSVEREHEESGEILGDFTRCIVDGIRTGEADVDNDTEITVTEIRRYLGGRIRGQSPRYWGLETSGDLLIARNPAPKPAALPLPLLEAMENPLPSVREGAVRHLGELLAGSNMGLVLAARAALAKLADDDSRRVSNAARELLDRYARPEPPQPAGSPEPEPTELPDYLAPAKPAVTPEPVEAAANPPPPVIEPPPVEDVVAEGEEVQPPVEEPPPPPAPPPATATLRVQSQPPGVQVLLRRGSVILFKGTTPWLQTLRPGQRYRLEVGDPRFEPDSRDVPLAAGEEREVSLTLKRKPAAAAASAPLPAAATTAIPPRGSFLARLAFFGFIGGFALPVIRRYFPDWLYEMLLVDSDPLSYTLAAALALTALAGALLLAVKRRIGLTAGSVAKMTGLALAGAGAGAALWYMFRGLGQLPALLTAQLVLTLSVLGLLWAGRRDLELQNQHVFQIAGLTLAGALLAELFRDQFRGEFVDYVYVESWYAFSFHWAVRPAIIGGVVLAGSKTLLRLSNKQIAHLIGIALGVGILISLLFRVLAGSDDTIIVALREGLFVGAVAPLIALYLGHRPPGAQTRTIEAAAARRPAGLLPAVSLSGAEIARLASFAFVAGFGWMAVTCYGQWWLYESMDPDRWLAEAAPLATAVSVLLAALLLALKPRIGLSAGQVARALGLAAAGASAGALLWYVTLPLSRFTLGLTAELALAAGLLGLLWALRDRFNLGSRDILSIAGLVLAGGVLSGLISSLFRGEPVDYDVAPIYAENGYSVWFKWMVRWVAIGGVVLAGRRTLLGLSKKTVLQLTGIAFAVGLAISGVFFLAYRYVADELGLGGYPEGTAFLQYFDPPGAALRLGLREAVFFATVAALSALYIRSRRHSAG